MARSARSKWGVRAVSSFLVKIVFDPKTDRVFGKSNMEALSCEYHRDHCMVLLRELGQHNDVGNFRIIREITRHLIWWWIKTYPESTNWLKSTDTDQ